jgi:hypothetical protein
MKKISIFIFMVLFPLCHFYKDQAYDIDVFTLNQSNLNIEIHWIKRNDTLMNIDTIFPRDTFLLISSRAFLCNRPECIIDSITITYGNMVKIVNVHNDSNWISLQLNDLHYKYYYLFK